MNFKDQVRGMIFESGSILKNLHLKVGHAPFQEIEAEISGDTLGQYPD